jgi:hypothetical protein
LIAPPNKKRCSFDTSFFHHFLDFSMHRSPFSPLTAGIILHARARLFPALAAQIELDQPWPCADGCCLQFEQTDDVLLVVLKMPERHLDLQQLKQLLMLATHGWPNPLAAGLSGETLQPVLFTRLPLDRLDYDLLLLAIVTLQQARQRWLAAPATPSMPTAAYDIVRAAQ